MRQADGRGSTVHVAESVLFELRELLLLAIHRFLKL